MAALKGLWGCRSKSAVAYFLSIMAAFTDPLRCTTESPVGCCGTEPSIGRRSSVVRRSSSSSFRGPLSQKRALCSPPDSPPPVSPKPSHYFPYCESTCSTPKTGRNSDTNIDKNTQQILKTDKEIRGHFKFRLAFNENMDSIQVRQ